MPHMGLQWLDARRVALVARFELAEALRSRSIVMVLMLYGAGAGLGAYVFSRALGAAEAAVRDSLLGNMGAHAVPDDVVRRHALPRVISFLVRDEALRAELLEVEPLALFYGFMALTLVPPLVLMTSGNTHASDLASGATRFVLTRCDRLSWGLGKLLGQAALLLVGLLVGAGATGLVALSSGGIDVASVLWLARAALRAWVYGLAYLGIFSCISLVVRRPSRARAASVAALFASWIGHAACQSSELTERVPALWYLAWAFPGQYEAWLWAPRAVQSLSATLALLAIGALAFAIGHAAFRRANA